MAARTLCFLAASSTLGVASAALLPGAALNQDALWDGGASLVQVQKAAVASLERFGRAPGRAAFDCSAAPMMCSAPFNCASEEIRLEWPAAKGPHVNFPAWCRVSAGFFQAIRECVSGNLEGWARLVLAEQQRHKELNVLDMDSQYCFLAGHCDVEEPIGRTVEEMEQMCDARFGGRGQWTTNFTFMDFAREAMSGVMDGSTHAKLFHLKHGLDLKVNRRWANNLAQLACAMGNYHCDLTYCKETYCNNPHWMAKHSHLSPKKALIAEQVSR